MKKKALGRGLEALIPEHEYNGTPPAEIDIDLISRNPSQPRLQLEEGRLEELASSIRQNGVLQPILVRPKGSGYQLVAGERRWLAAQRAGLLKVPAVVRDIGDDRLLELALVENIQREQLNAIEEARAFQSMIDALNLTQEAVAERLGKERSTVANALRLLKLPPPVQQMVAQGRLSAGHARALLASNAGPAELTRTAAMMIDQGWSVREAERWAKRQPKSPRAPRAADPDVLAAADRLRLLLGTKVEISTAPGEKGAGQIRIHFFSAEDLDRIYTLLTKQRS
jgi:ParB family transcriptional regulator, chromosome partitioning protein